MLSRPYGRERTRRLRHGRSSQAGARRRPFGLGQSAWARARGVARLDGRAIDGSGRCPPDRYAGPMSFGLIVILGAAILVAAVIVVAVLANRN